MMSVQDIGVSKKKCCRCFLVIIDDEKFEDIFEKFCREQNVKGVNGNFVVDSYFVGGNKFVLLVVISRSVLKFVVDVVFYK